MYFLYFFRLLGVSHGKYHLDIEALECVKNKDGHCNHSLPLPKDFKQDSNKNQSWMPMNNEDILRVANTDIETEDCARINSVEKWPTVNKRVWKQKQQKSKENVKRMRLASENCDTVIELGMEELIVLDQTNGCLDEQSAIIKQGADNQVSAKIEPFDTREQEVCANIVEQETSNIACTFNQSENDTSQTDSLKEQKNHAQFHSTHFDIRSSPIKPTSTIFRKFQINPELLAKYEAQIIRSIETVDKDHDRDKHMPCPTVEQVLQTNENVLQSNVGILHSHQTIALGENPIHLNENILHSSAGILNTNDVLQTSAAILNNNLNSQDLLHTNKDVMQDNSNVLHIEENKLQTSPDILCVNENALQISQDVMQNSENGLTGEDVLPTNDEVRDALVNDDTLQEMFRDEDLSAVKESFILDRELKDWILNRSNDEKSEDGFSQSNTLIQPALLHVKDNEIKSQLNTDQKVEIPTNDNHDDSSVLNFLDTLAVDLSYPGTEIRTNCGDFQIDLFSFNS